ncbi:puromycin-sensitive aminopeptidase-like [Coccinella septempunctata]|uniref:puromycin-sensitive aminopeptidase-like n=1 Tax=Coccinella septempunctata TaxID=41139 RepID=UPI001D09370A|nr:puromycin-sensitive aminopeptidase-like [Coccinella septempunctata]
MMYLCAEEHYARLPTIIKPNHYDLSLTFPNISKLEFEGVMTIWIEVFERTKQIQLHQLDLEVDSVKLVNAYNGISVEPESTDISKKDGILKLSFKNPVTVGAYRLKIKYEGLLSEEPSGIFYTKYYKPEEQTEKIAVFTHFEPTSARRCFPCWDEPSFKATFKINITLTKEYTALSNMPTERVEKLGKLRKYHFEKTPPMSTYLVALAIGEFSYIESRTNDGIPVRIITVLNKEEQGKFALDMSIKALKFFTEYFKTPYPLPKLDLIAVPDYKTDAMENWGLITFRDINLLIDPLSSTNLTMRWISLIVSHEVAHQWLGNLVSMEWWSQVWLQEACAQFAENMCVDYYFPNFQIWQHFALEFLYTALELEEAGNAHPVETVIKNPEELEDLYDGISYNKGSALIRMLHYYVGDDSFRKGLWSYLTNHMHKIASPDDFYRALEDASNKPVGSVMSTWSKQSGFPVVRVFITPGCDCKLNKSGITVKLVQNKFVNTQGKGKPENETVLWKIPISLITSSNPKDEIHLLMESREMKVFIPDVEANGWIKLNPGSVGYYRVQYSPELLKKLVPAIRDQKLNMIDRIGILNDLFHMVKYGYTNTGDLLKVLQAFDNEREFLVWSNICRILNKLTILIGHTSFEDEFKRFQSKLLEKASNSLGWTKKPEDNKFDHLVRKMVLGQMSWLDDEKMINEARLKVEEKLPDDLKVFCYRSMVRSGGEKEFETLMKLYKTVDTYEERKSILYALCGAKDEKLLRKVLTFSMSSETTAEETVLIVMTITSTKTGRDLLWDFYRTHWRDILNKVKNKEHLTKMIQDITEKYATESMAMEIETFFNKQLPCNEVTFRTALETLRNNAVWLDRDSEAIKQFLSPYQN